MAIFLSIRSQNTLFWTVLLKNKKDKFPIFYQKPWTNPFGKMPNFQRFFWLKMDSFLARPEQNTLFRTI